MSLCAVFVTMRLFHCILMIFFVSCVLLVEVRAAKKLNVEENISTLAKANTVFGINLYKQFIQDKSVTNVMFSPISISAAMAMAHLGAKGETAKQINDAFLFNLIEEGNFHSAFGELHGIMFDKVSENVTLKFSNRLFADKTAGILEDYKNALTVYGAKVNELDFANPSDASIAINKWIHETTEGKISHMISEDDVSVKDALILANTIYFKGAWHSKFIESHTEKRAFYVSHYKVVDTPFMFQRGKFRYGYIPSLTLQIVEMHYAGQEFSMIIFLPENFDLAAVENELNYENLTSWLSTLKYEDVDLSIPKFKIEESIQLHKILPELGVSDVFDAGKADLSGISSKASHIDQVLHKAVLEVDEEGSEAAAATTVRIVMRSMPFRPQFNANHPFVWALRHAPSEQILFMGRLQEPSGDVTLHHERIEL